MDQKKDMPLIKSFMTPFPHLISASDTVKEAKLVMFKHSIRHLPVEENGKIIGLLTDRDLKLAQAISRDIDFENHLVKDHCLHKPYIVKSTETADNVLEYMAKHRVGSALVTENRKLIGIFTANDACHAFFVYLRDHYR